MSLLSRLVSQNRKGSLVPSMRETGKPDLKGITLSVIKTQAKKVRFESAFKRV